MVLSVIKNRICFRGSTWEDNLFPDNNNKVLSSGRKPEEPGSNWRGTSSETQGQSVGPGEKARKSIQAWAEEPLSTYSHRMISKRSGECWLLIGRKKNALYYCAQSANSSSWVLFVSSFTTAISSLIVVVYEQRRWRLRKWHFKNEVVLLRTLSALILSRSFRQMLAIFSGVEF